MYECVGKVEARGNIGNSSQHGGLGPSWAAAGPSILPPPPLCQASTRYLLLHDGDPRRGSEPWVGVLGQGRLGTVIIC